MNANGFEQPNNGSPFDRASNEWDKFRNGSPSTSEQDTATILCHLAGPIAAVVSAGSLAIIGPLIAWFVYKDRSPVVAEAARTSFNFQITMWIAAVVGYLLSFTVVLAIIGIPVIILAAIASIVFGIIAAVKSAKGEPYSYPFSIEILK